MSVSIVSCYFKIKSKHSYDNYNIWMRNMLENIDTPMIIYCDLESSDMIRTYRGNKPLELVVMSFNDFYTMKYADYWEYAYEIDPERKIHNPLLYMIWNEKIAFVNRACSSNPFETDYFMWVDIGCFRNRIERGDIPINLIANFPNREKVKLIPDNKILFLRTCNEIKPQWRELMPCGLTTHDFKSDLATISGTMFIMHKNMVAFAFDSYYLMVELFIKNKRFAGKDQNVMMNLAMKYVDKIIIIPKCYRGDPWFGFHWIFL